MPIDYSAAVDEMFGMLFAIWPQVAAIAGYTPEIRWQGQPEPAQVPMDKIWARVSTQIVKEGQASLANADGVKKFHSVGLLYVQLFFPRTVPSTLDIGRQIATLIVNTFRKDSPSNVIWFRDQKSVELEPTAENYPINVVATFEYDELSSGGTSTAPIITPLGTATKHLPVETPDGIITTFTFPGLPSAFVLVWNGLIQGSFVRAGDTITMSVPPEIGAEFYVLY